jgi:hypothetical protein
MVNSFFSSLTTSPEGRGNDHFPYTAGPFHSDLNVPQKIHLLSVCHGDLAKDE